MSYLGDYLEDYATLNFKFTTSSSGVPFTLAGTPALAVYKANNLTQSTVGIALTVDFDALTGLNNVLIDLSSDVFYAIGNDYHVVITAGTVNSVSAVGTVVGEFSIQNRSSSLNALALSSLEDQYDGTGLDGPTYPATQAQAGNIATGSAAISVQAESQVLTIGTQVNDYTATSNKDNVYHQVTDVGGAIDIYYQFDVGGNGVASEVSMWGRLFSANDSLGIYAYNWVGAVWDQINTLSGSGGTTDGFLTFNLLSRHTGTGVNLGKVRIRGYTASGLTTSTLYLDQAYVSFAVVAQSVGYANGQIWINTVNGSAGIEQYVNGVAENPVDNIPDAIVLSGTTKTNLKDWHISSDSVFAPSSAINGYNIYGVGYTCTLGGYDYAGTHIYHASPMTGKAITVSGSDHFDALDSIVGNVEVDDAHFTNCSFNGTITLDQVTSGDLKIINSRSIIAGSATPIIDCGVAAVTHSISIADWQNGIEIRNLNNGGTNLFSISGMGQLIIAATCSGTMNVRGQWKITDNSAGAVTIVYDDAVQNISDILTATITTIPALVEARTPTAAELAYITTHAKTAKPVTFTGGTTTTAIIGNVDGIAASSTNDVYNGRILVFNAGTLNIQVTDITDYDGATKTATITAVTTAVTSSHTAVLV